MIRNNKLRLKSQQTFTVVIEEVNMISFSFNNDKWIQSINSVEIYAYVMNEDLARKKKDIKCNNIIKQYEKKLTMIMFQEKP